MTENIRVLTHSSIKITGEATVYVDPFQIVDAENDADIVLITHDHFDHFSPEDIARVIKSDTILVVPKKMKKQASAIPCGEIITVEPGEQKQVGKIMIGTITAYNPLKPFHPKGKGWVGYVIETDGVKIYVAGDTDITEENKKVVCDVAMVPIGGTFTMDAKKAAELVNIIRPKVAIPIHYGGVAGSKSDEEVFRANVSADISVEVKMESYGK